MEERTVWVRRQYNNHEIAKYNLSSITGIHWDNISGGVQAKSPNYNLYGYVNCQGMIEGTLAHSGIHGECPHSIKVCILKIDNPKIYEEIYIKYESSKPNKLSKKRKQTCFKDIKLILEEKGEPVSRERLLEELFNRGHSESAMTNAIKNHSDEIERLQCKQDKRKFEYRLRSTK